MDFCMCWEPDPAPPPRGLKRAGRDLLNGLLHVLGARPCPTSEGIETAGRDLLNGLLHMLGARPRPTSEGIETIPPGDAVDVLSDRPKLPPHLRGD